jgi:excisionase family DNA binding protein
MSNNLQLDSGSGGEVFYTLTAVCQMLSISRTTLWRMCKNGLRRVRIGGLVRIRKSDLDRYLRDHSE